MELEGQLGCAPRNSVQHHELPYYPPYYQQHLQCMPPTAISQHHQYPGPPPGQPIYGAPPNHEQATGAILRPQRKRTRATQVCLVRISLTYVANVLQACEECRVRKQKCDEGSPCSFCNANSLSCHYRDTPPTKYGHVPSASSFHSDPVLGPTRLWKSS